MYMHNSDTLDDVMKSRRSKIRTEVDLMRYVRHKHATELGIPFLSHICDVIISFTVNAQNYYVTQNACYRYVQRVGVSRYLRRSTLIRMKTMALILDISRG